MRITFFDDGIDFNGETSGIRAIGGAEKAFAHLAAALADRGHDVTMFNRCQETRNIERVQWLPWEMVRPPDTDILIAFRKPALLAEMDDAKRRVLWVWGKPKSLNQPANQAVLEKYMPSIVFTGSAHLKSWKSWRDFTNVAITPGVGDIYREPPEQDLSPHPTAVITTHPRHGLQKIIRMWCDRIHPVDVSAELHIYSAGLYRALDGGDLAEGLRPILEEVKDAKSSGVIVKRPVADAEMAKAYGRARAHLYPHIENEMYGSTLAESQAAGLPAIVKLAAKGIDPVTERIHNGQTGYLAPDDEAFANLTIDLLDENSTMYDNLSRDARTLQSTRSWDAAAIEFEALWK